MEEFLESARREVPNFDENRARRDIEFGYQCPNCGYGVNDCDCEVEDN